MQFYCMILLFLTAAVFCSPNRQQRIVGGEIAESGQFPYATAIYVTTSSATYFCGGALLNNQWILTSAACVDGAISFLVQVGSNLLQGTDDNRVSLTTSTFVLHPEYSASTLENDLSMIKLRLPIEFNQNISAINLPTTFIPDNTEVTAIGWGEVGDITAGLTNDLTFVPLITISNDECQLTYGTQIDDNMLCAAGNFNEGICSGDMGGPLIQTAGGIDTHIGIASFVSGNGCETSDPSGFTRTIRYIDWIQSVLAI